jgi:CubicO group peptidase (beta-lactamase class C family)
MKRGYSAAAALLAVLPIIVFLAGTGRVPAGLRGQTPGSADDGVILNSRFSAVADLIASGLDKKNIPSVSIAVAHKGRVVWRQSFGWADRGHRIKASPDTVYSLASTTKPMTATALMVLARRGQVDLDAPVERYIGPGLLTVYEGSAADVTVRRLLHHTAGLPQHYNYYYADEPERPKPFEETVRRFGLIVNRPGEVFQYANLGMAIVGHVVARVSGKPLAEFMSEEVYGPLGMSSAVFDPDIRHPGAIAAEYDSRGTLVPFHTCDTPGAGNGYVSVRDLIRFGMFHLKDRVKGTRRILDDAAIDLMRTEEDGARHRAANEAYGLGWFLGETPSGAGTVWHEGGWTGASAMLKLVPSEDAAVAVLVNAYATEFINLVTEETMRALLPGYGAAGDRAKASAPAAAPAQPPSVDMPPGTYTGEIRTLERAIRLTLERSGDGAIEARLGDPASPPVRVRDVPAAVPRAPGQIMIYFPGPLGDPDPARSRHNVVLDLKWVGGELVGTASAMTPSGLGTPGVEGERMYFWLPYRVTLERTGPSTAPSR